MKIKLTERQYSKLIKEATWSRNNLNVDSIVDLFKSDSKRFNQSREGLAEFFNLFFNVYGLNIEDVMNNKKLYNIVLSRSNHLMDFRDKQQFQKLPNDFTVVDIFSYILFTEYEKILNMGTPEQKYNNLHTLFYRFYTLMTVYGENELLREIQRHLDRFSDDMIKYIVKTYDPIESIKRLSILNRKSHDPKVDDTAKEIANKNGITLISKHMGYSFNRKDDSMIRDLINYMKDISDIKKTKRGFLDYIGSHYSGGQYSHFWSAANHSGIIEKVGGGSNVTYKLGPNYEAWEKGKVVAF
jgi:hypothetical protein